MITRRRRKTTSLNTLTATEALRLLRKRDISAEELVGDCLTRIEEAEPAIRAWAHLDADLALAQARRCDRQAPRGALHGLPIGIKDIIDTHDQPTAYGAHRYTGYRPLADADCVRRLRQAGAVILGKTVTTELAASYLPVRTANPCDVTRTPGGSSAGSAAAVAAEMVPLAIGTQTAGSVIRPASFCGVYGLKTTAGAVDLTGVRPVAPTLDTLGAFARSAEDLWLIASPLLNRPLKRTTEALRIALVRPSEWNRIDSDLRAILESFTHRLRTTYRSVSEPELPRVFDELTRAHEVVMAVEAASSLSREREQYGDQMGDDILLLLDRGVQQRAKYEAALAVASRCRAELRRTFQQHDVLIAPTVLGEAPRRDQGTGDPLHCRSWTLLGTPAVAVPGLTGPTGLPTGLQVIARHGEDALALSAVGWLWKEMHNEGPTP